MNQGFLRQYGSLLAALGAVVIVAHFFAIALPAASRIRETNDKIRNLQAKEKQAQNRINTLSQLSSLATRSPTDYSRLTVALPAAAAVEEIYVTLEALAARTGLTITNITASKPDKDRVPIEVSVKGVYQGTGEFMTLVNQNLRPAEIKQAAIASTKSDGEIVLTATFKLEFFMGGGK